MIAIVCAMENEIIFYKTKIQNLVIEKKLDKEFLIGRIGENEVVLTKCGIGKVNSSIITSLLIQNYNPSLIINTGIAGGVKPLKTSDLFIADKFMYGDFDLQIFGYKKGQVPGCEPLFYSSKEHSTLLKNYLVDNSIIFNNGLVVTQDSFITSLNQLSGIDDEMIATDMEGASMAHTCTLFNVPFLSIRIISDVIDNEQQILNYQEFEDNAAKLSSEVSYNFLLKVKI